MSWRDRLAGAEQAQRVFLCASNSQQQFMELNIPRVWIWIWISSFVLDHFLRMGLYHFGLFAIELCNVRLGFRAIDR